MEDFEGWRRRHIPIRRQPFVSIQKGGRNMSVNRSAYEALEKPEAVELLFSRKRNAIALRAVSPTEPYAVPVRPQTRNALNPSTYLVSVGAFVKDYEIPYEVAMRYPVEVEEGTLVVYLDSGMVATGPRLRESVGS